MNSLNDNLAEWQTRQLSTTKKVLQHRQLSNKCQKLFLRKKRQIVHLNPRTIFFNNNNKKNSLNFVQTFQTYFNFGCRTIKLSPTGVYIVKLFTVVISSVAWRVCRCQSLPPQSNICRQVQEQLSGKGRPQDYFQTLD